MTIVHGEKCPRNETLCFLPTVEWVSQLRRFPPIPYPFNFARRRWWGTESNAFVKSSKITSALCESFLALAHEWKVSSNCDRQERFFMKPNCSPMKTWWSVQKFTIDFLTIFSQILLAIEVRKLSEGPTQIYSSRECITLRAAQFVLPVAQLGWNESTAFLCWNLSPQWDEEYTLV